MIELSRGEMYRIQPLCMGKEDVVLWSCAEGKIGRAWVDRIEEPGIAVVAAADFCFLLGNFKNSKAEMVTKIISAYCRGKIIIADDPYWGSLIERHYLGEYRKFKRYAIKREPDVFRKERLQNFISAVELEFHVERMNEALYYKVLEEAWTADFCSNFSSQEEYRRHGIGYVVIHGGEIISGASSYGYCEGAIEISVGTKNEYRRKGLALACASRLIFACLERNIYPRWDAANLQSVALAEKLGYHFDKEYVVYSI